MVGIHFLYQLIVLIQQITYISTCYEPVITMCMYFFTQFLEALLFTIFYCWRHNYYHCPFAVDEKTETLTC